MSNRGIDDPYKKWLREEQLKEGNNKIRSAFGITFWGILSFIILGIVILYWFLPLTLEIIDEKIIERYGIVIGNNNAAIVANLMVSK